uniref:Transmembrane protein n=1 Tax=Strongyloides stercoralis TaxID=6248 RepID=A0A0K0EIP9_STRER
MQSHYYQNYEDDEIITREDEIDELEDEAIFQQSSSSYPPSSGTLTPLVDRQVVVTTFLNIVALVACFYCLYTDQKIDGIVSIFVCWLKIREAKQEYLGNLEFSEFVKNVSSQDLITDDSSNRSFFNIPKRSNHKAIFV